MASRSVGTAAHKVAKGDWVQVHYTGKLDDGTQFDSSRERDPLEFVVGDGMVIAGFDQAVSGLEVGETRTSRIEPANAYGEWSENMTAKLERSRLPEQLKDIALGTALQLNNGMRAVVTEVGTDTITLDANHELAGKHLNFDVELMKVVPQAKMKKALFGAGCFWSVELAYQRQPGVVTTTVGYSQGKASVPGSLISEKFREKGLERRERTDTMIVTDPNSFRKTESHRRSHTFLSQTENPTYDDVCTGESGHNEVVLCTYNEDEVSYKDLLRVFFSKHDPTTLNRSGADVGTQYRSGIYYFDEEQKAIAEAYIAEEQAKYKDKIVTELEPAATFYRVRLGFFAWMLILFKLLQNHELKPQIRRYQLLL